jgi:hypothetical protein
MYRKGGGIVMKKIINTLFFGFMLTYITAQNSYFLAPNYQGYYYAEGVTHIWQNDSTSANIIVKNMHNFNAIVANLTAIFSDSTDVISADGAEDDNIIVNSLSLPLFNKDSLIALIQIETDDISFFTYSKIVDNNRLWLRNEVLVKYKDSSIMTLTDIQVRLSNYDLISITQEPDNEYSILCKNEYDLMNIANMLYDTSKVIYSTPDFYSNYQLYTNDPYYSVQWGLHNTGQSNGTVNVDINAPEAWAFLKAVKGQVGYGIKVAVIDDGVDPHDDFYGDNGYNRLLDGYTANGYGTGRPIGEKGDHGQCCAGIIAAGHNNICVAGIAPNSLIVPIRIFKKNGKFFSNKRISPFGRGSTSFALSTQAMPAFIFNTFPISTYTTDIGYFFIFFLLRG